MKWFISRDAHSHIYNCLPSLCVLPNTWYHFSRYSLGVAFLLMGCCRYTFHLNHAGEKALIYLKRLSFEWDVKDVIRASYYHAYKIFFNASALSFSALHYCDARAIYQINFFYICVIYLPYNLFYSNSCRYYSNCDPRGGSSGASHINYEQRGDSGWSYSAVCTGPGHSIFCPRCAFASFPRCQKILLYFSMFCFYNTQYCIIY